MRTQRINYQSSPIACKMSNQVIIKTNMPKWKTTITYTTIIRTNMPLETTNSFSKSEKWKTKHAWEVGIRKVGTAHQTEIKKCTKVFKNLDRKIFRSKTTFISQHRGKVARLMKFMKEKLNAKI